MSLRRCITAGLLFAGAGVFAKGAYIPAKAMAAQVLLERAWDKTAQTGEAALPWSSLDAYPAARLHMPDGGTHIVLSTDSGQALAFGPGIITGTDLSGDTMIGIAAHKNTHFGSLKDILDGDVITLEKPLGDRVRYRVMDRQIIDTRHAGLAQRDETILALVTCYPFDAVSFNGPLRYVVLAEKVASS